MAGCRLGFVAAALALVITACPVEPPTNAATITVGGTTLTVIGPGGSTVTASGADAATLPAPPPGTRTTTGPVHIEVNGITPASVATLTLRFGVRVRGVLKLIDGVWDPFEFDGSTGATVAGDGMSVTLRLRDGGRGDADGQADGRVVDPVMELDWTPPPVLDLPTAATAPVVVGFESGTTPVTWAASAAEYETGAPLPVSCSPLSGSEFAFGITTVTCSATDSLGVTTEGTFPVTVQHAATSVAAGPDNTCVVLADRTARCWGWNNTGALGNGEVFAGQVATPVPVVGLGDIRRISPGDEHTCAIVGDLGEVYCWGRNQSGELGDGTTIDSLTPVRVEGLGRAVDLAAGRDRTCALIDGGTVRCWGELSGTYPPETSPTPVAVAGVEHAVSISVGIGNACALIDDGTLRCWGSNVGAAVAATPTAVPVAGLSGVVGVDVGGDATCAVVDDGTVSCWGSNDGGQLGDGTTAFSWEPVQAVGLTSAVSVSSGNSHSCAGLADGTVRCWGKYHSWSPEVGDVFPTLTPARAGSLGATEWIEDNASVVAGGNRTCSLRASGLVACWGTPPLGSAAPSPIIGRAATVTPLI